MAGTLPSSTRKARLDRLQAISPPMHTGMYMEFSVLFFSYKDLYIMTFASLIAKFIFLNRYFAFVIHVHCIMGFEGKLIYMHSTIHIKSGPNVEFLKIFMFQLYMITEQSRKKIFSVSLQIRLHSLHFFIFLNQASP